MVGGTSFTGRIDPKKYFLDMEPNELPVFKDDKYNMVDLQVIENKVDMS